MTAAVPERDPQWARVLDLQRQDPGPTALRMVLGGQLRRLREERNISVSEAAGAIRASHPKISRMELGRVGFKERDVADLLTLYGVHDEEERGVLLTLARRANAPGWWHKYHDVLPGWFEQHLGLEGAASLIRTYEVQFLPGLLQTEDYARAVIRLGHPKAPAAEVERRVALRTERQRVLTGSDPIRLWAVVDEAALRRPMGGQEVMQAQLKHLLEVTRQPNVTLQVVPFHAGGHAAAGGPITLLRFEDQDLPDIVYLEQLTSALYLDKRDEVDHYLAVMDRLCVEAATPAETEAFVQELLDRA
ncbi:helix-turn-helix transcriptional regulator [Streptomyces thermolineatus]|uniref:Helix-turn-helix transcriptional regulator n=1 Tax=Streptomyces thermolineatus TaxID=44033 RepID=A0ABN3MRI3_9ACTN